MGEYIVTEKIAAERRAVVSDQHPPPPQYREFPRSSVELAGQAVSDVSHGVRAGGPLMMGVLLLNVIGIGCAVYFLSILINGQAQHLGNLLTRSETQMKQIVDVHNREFDALMEMQAKANAALAAVHALYTPPPQPLQVAPPPGPLTLTPPAQPPRR